MKNTFTGFVMAFPNDSIHAICSEILKFRRQLTLRPEGLTQSGWNDALNDYMKRQIEALGVTVKRVTYSPSGSDPADVRKKRVKQAKDTSETIQDAFDGKSINTDDLVMPARTVDREISYDLTGLHKDYPQPTHDRVENDWFRSFVIGLDAMFVMSTNLDSRHLPTTINAYESAQIQAHLGTLLTICNEKGGEENRTETPTGVMASDRPATFNADGAADPPSADPQT